MMQSAAVLPTESPVKSLPEILGVPLQRKTFSPSIDRPMCCGLPPRGRGDEGEPRRLSRTGQQRVIQLASRRFLILP